MKMFLAAAAAVLAVTPASAGDDGVTAAQRAGVMRALSAAGCSNPASIERDDGGFEVDNARCKDGTYDLKVSAQYRIVSRDREDSE